MTEPQLSAPASLSSWSGTSWHACPDLDALPRSFRSTDTRLAMLLARDVVAVYRLVFTGEIIVFRGLVDNKQNDVYDMFLLVADELVGSNDSP